MSVEPYKCDLDPDTNTTLEAYLFKNVKNVEAIRQNVINGDWKCAVIKPSLIVDMFQVTVAANRAVLSERSQTMVTKNVYTEILYNLSLSTNISKSLSKFGVEKHNVMLICFLITNNEVTSGDIIREIDGEPCPMSHLSSFTSMTNVKKVYKLDSLAWNKDPLGIIVSKMVTKNFINH